MRGARRRCPRLAWGCVRGRPLVGVARWRALKPGQGEKGVPAEGMAMEKGGWLHARIVLRTMKSVFSVGTGSQEQGRGELHGAGR